MKKGVFLFHFIKATKLCSILTVALFFMALITSAIKPAHAIEELAYTPAKDSSPSLRLQLDVFLRGNFKSDSSEYTLTSTDLNGDNLLEHILKRNNCGQYTNVCTHLIIAEKIDKLTLLSKIDAHSLMIGDGKSYGIKNLLVFKNQTNAYNFDIYMWSPHEKMYILKPDKKRD